MGTWCEQHSLYKWKRMDHIPRVSLAVDVSVTQDILVVENFGYDLVFVDSSEKTVGKSRSFVVENWSKQSSFCSHPVAWFSHCCYNLFSIWPEFSANNEEVSLQSVEIPMIPVEMLLLLFILEMLWKMVLNNEGFFPQFKIQKMRKTFFLGDKKIQCGLIGLSKYCLHRVLVTVRLLKLSPLTLRGICPSVRHSARNVSIMSLWR